MRSLQIMLLVPLLGFIVLVGGSVRADTTDDAKAAFEDGTQLFGQEKFAQAADAFRKAFHLKRSWKILFNIGQSEAAAKRFGLALEAFERYLAEGGDDVTSTRRDTVLDEVQRLRAMVGSLDIRAPDGAIISVDDVERGNIPLAGPLMVSAGVEHQVVVSFDGEKLIDRVVRLSGGKSMLLEVEDIVEEDEDTEPPADLDPADPVEEVSPVRTWGWVTLGLGGAMVIGGVVTGGMALSINNDLKEQCSDGSCLESDEENDVKKRDSLALSADILIGVGVAATVVGVLMLTVFDKDESGSGAGAGVALKPLLGPEMGGATLEWRF